MSHSSVRTLALFALAFAIAGPAAATCGGGGGGGMGGMMPPTGSMTQPQVYFVPWKVLNSTEDAVKGSLILYWLPVSGDEIKHSDLLNSRQLTIYSSQCVGMQVIRPDDAATIDKLGATGKLPAAILSGPDGKELARLEGSALRLGAVEKMVRAELDARENAAQKALDEANGKAAAGEKDAAVDTYKKVWDDRCLLPKKGRAAQKALKKLGVAVEDARLRELDPMFDDATTARITKKMNEGLHAELHDDYPLARRLYAEAAAIDAADPVPLRFLGELYRHHLGDWVKAREVFARLLGMQADPLSRAVALHGLGKMTIHDGDYAKGLAMFHQSIAAFPLALTYRNLAVYWNSEKERAKADGFVKKALLLEPDDPFNLIFAATYMVDSGRSQEALAIAKEHEGMLCASYNLAAIYALLGQKGKAMELLHRHFYTFERYDAVREKEMMEARVDYVFESLRGDAAFKELTKLAR
ncbi:MAG TPA: tetratricopeptide repeat protein [Thermoanaerobaculia bacterium]|jgi:tetratricopeptide (TPR) repeat protein|nr:tetratricopeptide repeat protein [Thermoanaerobaculia bacterium]